MRVTCSADHCADAFSVPEAVTAARDGVSSQPTVRSPFVVTGVHPEARVSGAPPEAYENVARDISGADPSAPVAADGLAEDPWVFTAASVAAAADAVVIPEQPVTMTLLVADDPVNTTVTVSVVRSAVAPVAR